MSHHLYDYIGGNIFLDIDESPMMRARKEQTGRNKPDRSNTVRHDDRAEWPGLAF
ncbi:MAG: hypothetical protein O3C40_35020 [Planctomycetota bacterium]|nr:hypothetical protein [Planctomycetota bacterium]